MLCEINTVTAHSLQTVTVLGSQCNVKVNNVKALTGAPSPEGSGGPPTGTVQATPAPHQSERGDR